MRRTQHRPAVIGGRSPTGGVLSYEVRPAGTGFKNGKSRCRLEVRRGGDKVEVVNKAREFVESARAGATTAQPLEGQQIGVLMLSFGIPSDEVELVAPPGNQLFQKMRLDDEI